MLIKNEPLNFLKNLIPITNNPQKKKTVTSSITPADIMPMGENQPENKSDNHFKLPEKTRIKYNSAICTAVDLTPEGISPLKELYHDIHGLPGFVHRFLHGRPSLGRALFVEAPQMYRMFDTPEDETKTLLMPNPAYVDVHQFLADGKNKSYDYAVKQLKNSPNGLALVTWYIHPKALPKEFRGSVSSTTLLEERVSHLKQEAALYAKESDPFSFYRYGPDRSALQRVGSFSQLPRTNSQKQIRALESKSNTNYLATMFDLDTDPQQSLNYLIALRQTILRELESVYGVTPNDKIKLYLHMPYLEVTTTLHVHIRVNQADHALEDSKSFGLNEVVEQLQSGLTVTQMILDRQTIYCSEYPIAEGVQGVTVKTVPNPKRDWDDVFGELQLPNKIHAYLMQALQYEEVLIRLQLLDAVEINNLCRQLIELPLLPSIPELTERMMTLTINPELKKLGYTLEMEPFLPTPHIPQNHRLN